MDEHPEPQVDELLLQGMQISGLGMGIRTLRNSIDGRRQAQ
jgi:hypothetical protein